MNDQVKETIRQLKALAVLMSQTAAKLEQSQCTLIKENDTFLTLSEVEDLHIKKALSLAPSMGKAAGMLGIDQAMLYRHRVRMGLEKKPPGPKPISAANTLSGEKGLTTMLAEHNKNIIPQKPEQKIITLPALPLPKAPPRLKPPEEKPLNHHTPIKRNLSEVNTSLSVPNTVNECQREENETPFIGHSEHTKRMLDL